MMAYLNTAPQKLAPRWLAQWNFLFKIISAVLNEDTGELMEYIKLMWKPKYGKIYRNSYAN